MDFKLYYAAINADAEFHAALVSVYGENKAGGMRYLAIAQNHPEVKASHDAWRRAMEAWLTEMKLRQP